MTALISLLTDLPEMGVPKKMEKLSPDQEMEESFADLLSEGTDGFNQDASCEMSLALPKKEASDKTIAPLDQDTVVPEKIDHDDLSDEDAFLLFMQLSFPEEWQKETILVDPALRKEPSDPPTSHDALGFSVSLTEKDAAQPKVKEVSIEKENSALNKDFLYQHFVEQEKGSADLFLQKEKNASPPLLGKNEAPSAKSEAFKITELPLEDKNPFKGEPRHFSSKDTSPDRIALMKEAKTLRTTDLSSAVGDFDKERNSLASQNADDAFDLMKGTFEDPFLKRELHAKAFQEKGFKVEMSEEASSSSAKGTAQGIDAGAFSLEDASDGPVLPLIQEHSFDQKRERSIGDPIITPLSFITPQAVEKTSAPLPQQPISSSVPQEMPVHIVTLDITPPTKERAGSLHLKLEPEHLGKVDVKVNLTQDGRLDAVVHVEKNHALELFRQDASELQRLIAEAFGQESTSMDFNLTGGDDNLAREKNLFTLSNPNQRSAGPDLSTSHSSSYGGPRLDASRALDTLA